MNRPSDTACPFHGAAAPIPPHPPGVWPPGPAAGVTGWSLLLRMSRDLLGTVQQWRQAHGDVIHLGIWPEHQIIVTDPALARELLVNHHQSLIRWERGISVFSQLHGRSVLIAEGAPWRAKRQALQPAFSPKTAQAFVPDMVQAAQAALAAWPDSAPAWPVEHALTSLTMDVIARMVFSNGIGATAGQAAQALHDVSIAANAEFFWPASWPDWMPWKRKKRQALRLLDRLVGDQISARLRLPEDTWPDDLLTRLLAAHRADPAAWPLDAVRDECMTAFLAGHETAAATLTWWAWCMAANPAAQTEAQREVHAVLQGRAPAAADLPSLRYLTQTLQETMRLYPAAPVLLTRRATAPITLGPWQLPARTLFMIPVQLMQQDERWFPEPQAFRPERFAPKARSGSDASPAQEAPRGAFMPFGAGPRICLGQHLVMAEMTVIAAMILQRHTLDVPPGMAAPTPVMNVTLRPQSALQLALCALPCTSTCATT